MCNVVNLNVNLTSVLSFTVSPLELMLCGTLMFGFLFAVFRFILWCDVGSVGISDFLFCEAQAGERDRAQRRAWRGRSKRAQCWKICREAAWQKAGMTGQAFVGL